MFSISSGDAFKYRDFNERRNDKFVSYQRVKKLNMCDKSSTLQQKFARLREYLYGPIEFLNIQNQLDNVVLNSKKEDYLVMYSPDSGFLNKIKFEF